MAWDRDYDEVATDVHVLRAVTLTDQDLRDIVAVLEAHPLAKYSAVKFRSDEHRTTDPDDLFNLPQKPSRLVLSAGTDIFVFLDVNRSSVYLEKSNPDAVKAGDKIIQILEPRQVPKPKKWRPSRPFVIGTLGIFIVGISLFFSLRTFLSYWWAWGIATAVAWIMAGILGGALGRAQATHSLLARYEPEEPWYLQHFKVLTLVLAALAVIVPSALAFLPEN